MPKKQSLLANESLALKGRERANKFEIRILISNLNSIIAQFRPYFRCVCPAYNTGSMVVAPRSTIHQMSSVSYQPLVTVHVYCPPVSKMKVFDPTHDLEMTVSDDCGAWFPKDERQIVTIRNLAETQSS